MDHRSDSPAWMSGSSAVGTGADPPDQDNETGDQPNGDHPYAGNGHGYGENANGYAENGSGYAEVGNGNGEAPGFSHPSDAPGFGEASPDDPDFGHAQPTAPGFSDDNGSAPDFGGAPEHAPDFGNGSPGYGEIVTGAQDFSALQNGSADYGSSTPEYGSKRLADPFEAPGAGGFGSPAEPGQGFGSPADPSQGFGEDQPEYGGEYRNSYSGNDYRGAYGASQDNGGYGASQDHGYGPSQDQAGQFGSSSAGSNSSAAGVGTMYGQQTYPGQENGAGGQTQSPEFTSQYPAVEPPGRPAKKSGSLKAVKRPKGVKKRGAPSGRQAQLTLTRFEPWSVMKFSFIISLVAFIILFVAVALLYVLLSALGVFSAIQHTIENITSSQSSSGFNLTTYLSASRVLGYTGLLGAINVVLITALCTVGSVLYNITASLAGGVEVTLKETE